MFSNTTGGSNTANGDFALGNNIDGNHNVAVGERVLFDNTSGVGNTAIGDEAGSNQTTGSENVYIGYGVEGVAGESHTIRIGNSDITDTFIRGISGATTSGGGAVYVNGNGKLGTLTSSARFKEDIKPMDKASEVILALKPVSFRSRKPLILQACRTSGWWPRK